MNCKKQITTLLATAIIASLCQPTIDTSAASIKLNKTKIQMTQGKTTTLKVKGTKKKAKWSIKSGKKYIKLQKKRKASVKIRALKAGTAKVQCKIGKKKLVCKVTVKAKTIKTKVIPQATMRPTLVPMSTPSQTTEPTGLPIRTHTPTENRLMAEPVKSILLPAADEEGVPISYHGGRRRYYFFGTSIQRMQIEEIQFTDNIQIPEDAIGSFDVSEKQNESVISWYTDRNADQMYEVVIAQEGGVVANPDSSHLFADVGWVSGMEHFYTTGVKDMSYMFWNFGVGYATERPEELYLDLGDNFDTSTVENMDYMFAEAAPWQTLLIRLGKGFRVQSVKTAVCSFDSPYMGKCNFIVPNVGVQSWILAPENMCEFRPDKERFAVEE